MADDFILPEVAKGEGGEDVAELVEATDFFLVTTQQQIEGWNVEQSQEQEEPEERLQGQQVDRRPQAYVSEKLWDPRLLVNFEQQTCAGGQRIVLVRILHGMVLQDVVVQTGDRQLGLLVQIFHQLVSDVLRLLLFFEDEGILQRLDLLVEVLQPLLAAFENQLGCKRCLSLHRLLLLWVVLYIV